ncbi:lipase esterase family [Colletotrichum tofieldiae]|uniref:Lipase esterase family n=1 Tax=Colletotrichum tofieldiae TaxID=708197 RepID=A0A166TQR2_9PEZI|nr:lipase esterase family [Colletotrichum tofieldiae]GKT56397.1 lipase esterase family [Colletotrichum tofieldiae]GKT76634.1 lipase esterase family [Colletotrichum tofieldiae]GKT87685.1 lipase esterase family [Colletotrichum tofieldiae]
MLRTIKDIALAFVRPTLDALFFGRHLPWSLRWRLLALQPIVFLTNSLVLVPTLFRRPYTVIHIPINPGRSLRALLFKEPGTGTGRKGLRPLHVDCHAGGFVGGIPEASVPFCSLVAAETGAVVISLSYRLAPVHPFPAAIDDVDAAIAWLRQHAAEEFGADPALMTVSGASAGGNLVLAANQRLPSEEFAIRAAVTFYAPVDLRLRPEDKPRPASFPKKDPMSFMQPLYDSYAAPSKAKDLDNPRMSPFLASEETLPERMVLVVAAIDILVQEQLMFVERVKNEREAKGKSGSSIEAVFVEEAFHGWLEVPNSVIPMEKKMTMLDKGLELVKHTHTQYGYRWEKTS